MKGTSVIMATKSTSTGSLVMGSPLGRNHRDRRIFLPSNMSYCALRSGHVRAMSRLTKTTPQACKRSIILSLGFWFKFSWLTQVVCPISRGTSENRLTKARRKRHLLCGYSGNLVKSATQWAAGHKVECHLDFAIQHIVVHSKGFIV